MNGLIGISIIGLFVGVSCLLSYLVTFSFFPVVITKDKKDVITYCYCRRKYKDQVIKQIKNAVDIEVV